MILLWEMFFAEFQTPHLLKYVICLESWLLPLHQADSEGHIQLQLLEEEPWWDIPPQEATAAFSLLDAH